MSYQIIHSDCKNAIQELIDKGIQVDSIVTDPPYELGFMGKSWDSTGIAYDKELWELALQVLKPGGHLLAFSGSRTYHRMTCAIEDAGFEIRDQIMWIYGQGFPKSLDISKAIDKMEGAEREVKSENPNHREISGICYKGVYAGGNTGNKYITAPATDLAKQWSGFGTALKPAHEPIVMARKPLSEKNIALNVIKHGTGAINIDECRVELSNNDPEFRMAPASRSIPIPGQYTPEIAKDMIAVNHHPLSLRHNSQGRFPANLIHDGSEEVEAEFAKYGERVTGDIKPYIGESEKGFLKGSYVRDVNHKGSRGSASRFFYSAKASKQDRNGSKHPTVKPISLMKYLCRLVTPPGGIILDPFAGSGTTGQAAVEQDFEVILIEKEAEYVEDIKRRMEGVPLTLWQMDKLNEMEAST